MDQNCLGYVTQTTGYEKLRTIAERIFPNPEFSLASQMPEATPLVVKKFNELDYDCREISSIQEAKVGEIPIAF